MDDPALPTNKNRKGNSTHEIDDKKVKKQEEKQEVVLKLPAQEKKDSNFKKVLDTLIFLESPFTIAHSSVPEIGSAEYFFHQEQGTSRSEWTRYLDEKPSGRRPNHWRY